MPKSIIEERLDAVWADVTAAVSKGLTADEEEKTLADLVPIVAKKPESAAWLPPSPRYVPLGGLRLRQSAPPCTVVEYEFCLTLAYDDLASPDTEWITTWAAAARTFELSDVLGRLASSGGQAFAEDIDVGMLRDAAPGGGWGQIRCVTFGLDAAVVMSLDLVKQLGWEGPIPLEARLPDQRGIGCLLLRKGGGPHLRREAGLALGWLPAPYGAVDLVLAEQFEIVNAGPLTVTAIHLGS